MAFSSGGLDSLVVLYFHNFRAERMRHWWNLLGGNDHANIEGVFGKFSSFMRLRVDRGLLEALTSFWDPTHCCFSIREMDLVPTLEEYAELLQLGSPFSETPIIPTHGPRSNRVLEKYLGLTSTVLCPEICRVDGTWRNASISLDLLTKYFFWGDFPVEFAKDFIAGKQDWGKFRVNAFKIAFAGPLCPPYCALIVLLPKTRRGGPDVLHAASPIMVLQSFASWRVTWGPAVWRPWTHCSLFDGVPLLGVWGCTGYYPSLALRQFSGIQYPPRLGDLSTVTFDCIPSSDMWRLLSGVKDMWGGRRSEMVLVEDGLPADSSVTADFAEWREGWNPSFNPRPIVRLGMPHPSVPPSLRVLTSHANRGGLPTWRESSRRLGQSCNAAVANLHRDLEVQGGNASVLQEMNNFIREQLEISEEAKDHLEEALIEAQGQLEALVDPSTGRPHDIVALRRALDESEASLTAARTSIGAIWDALASDASWLNSEGLPVVRALHQATRVMDFLGAWARAVLEEYEEGDLILSTTLGRFCMKTCI
uniref:DUF7745 domain-containing protein n=1 Tax=Fagus sylvatica TaxID=28930 RepID=A0A2N9I3T8_FAGSY